MHELALCRAIADTVGGYSDGGAISTVYLRIGHLRQVVPTTLEFCWRATVGGTELSGSVLSIDHVPVSVSCAACAHVSSLPDPVLRCPTCGGFDVEVLTGEEFMIESIDLARETESIEMQ